MKWRRRKSDGCLWAKKEHIRYEVRRTANDTDPARRYYWLAYAEEYMHDSHWREEFFPDEASAMARCEAATREGVGVLYRLGYSLHAQNDSQLFVYMDTLGISLEQFFGLLPMYAHFFYFQASAFGEAPPYGEPASIVEALHIQGGVA